MSFFAEIPMRINPVKTTTAAGRAALNSADRVEQQLQHSLRNPMTPHNTRLTGIE
jgi:hypothetical protein